MESTIKTRETREEIAQRSLDEFINLLKTSECGLISEEFISRFVRIVQLTVTEFDSNNCPYEASNHLHMERYLNAMLDIRIDHLTVPNTEERMKSIKGLCHILSYAYEEALMRSELELNTSKTKLAYRNRQIEMARSTLLKEPLPLHSWWNMNSAFVPWDMLTRGQVKYKSNGTLYLTFLGKLELRWKNNWPGKQLLIKTLSWLHS